MIPALLLTLSLLFQQPTIADLTADCIVTTPDPRLSYWLTVEGPSTANYRAILSEGVVVESFALQCGPDVPGDSRRVQVYIWRGSVYVFVTTLYDDPRNEPGAWHGALLIKATGKVAA